VRDAKKELANKRAAKIAKDKEEKGAATKLQSLQRGRKGRKRYTTPLAHARAPVTLVHTARAAACGGGRLLAHVKCKNTQASAHKGSTTSL